MTTRDGLALHLRHWPVRGTARGSVLLVHGLGEHSGRHAGVAARLNAAGWHAFCHDQRGHGRSGGARGAIAHPQALLDDLALVIDEVAARLPRPLVLLGHSLGGLVAARFVAGSLEGAAGVPAWSRPVDGLILSSPAFDIGMSPMQRLMLAVLGPLAPRLAVGNGLDPAWLSRDPAVVAAYRADPLVHDRITPGLARFILDGGVHVRALAPQWRVPTLLLWAGSDRCVAPEGSRAFVEGAPASRVEERCFPALYHELFNEPEKEEVFALLDDWLRSHAVASA